MQNFPEDNRNLALSKFEKMLKSNKVFFFDSEEFEDIVYYYLDSGKIKLANKAVALSLSQHPSSLRLKLIKVELLIFEDKQKEAEKLLNQLEKLAPTYDEIYIQKAALFAKKNMHEDAIFVLIKALKYTNDYLDVHSLIGMEYLFLEKFETAIKHFRICLDIDEEDYTSLYNIIYCFDMLENPEEAILFLNNFIDENPYSEIAWHQLGRQYFKMDNYNEAIRAFDYAILIDESFVGAYFEKAKTLEVQKKYEEAILNYKLTLTLDDPTAFTYIQIGNCFVNLKNTKSAIYNYHKATQEDPMLEQGWLCLTELYLEEENTQKALYFIQKALEVDPTSRDFLNLFAKINIRLNLFEEAANAFEEAIVCGEDRLEIYLALADVLHFIGDYQEALESLLIANDKLDYSVEVVYRISGLYLLLRKEKEGLFYLENALKKDVAYFNNIKQLFTNVFNKESVKQLLEKYT